MRIRGMLGMTVVTFAVAGAARADIIDNGGFETGDFSGWSATVSGLLEVAAFGHTGQHSARFGHRTVLANVLAQSVHTEMMAGQTYRLDLWVYNLGIGDDYLSASNLSSFGFVMDPVATPLEEWSQVSQEFVFDGSTNPFSLVGYDSTSEFYVDDVSITLVPAPGVACTAGLGALGLAGRRRRALVV